MKENKNKLSICLWFDGRVSEAAEFYTVIFKDSKNLLASKFLAEAPGNRHTGDELVSEIEINGMKVQLLNGGPMFKQSEAFSFVVNCEDQAQVDFYWEKLIEGGGSESQCGWLKDKFGVSWQVVPKQLMVLMSTSDKNKNKKVFEAMMKMKKIIIADLESAANEN